MEKEKMTVKELREKRMQLAEQAKQIITKADNEKRAINAEENEKFEKIHADIDALYKEIQIREKQESLEAQLASVSNTIGRESRQVEQPQIKSKSEAELENWRAYLRTGEHRALSYVAGEGGYLAPSSAVSDFTKILRDLTPVRQAPVRVFQTQNGNDINWATINDTSKTGAATEVNSAVAVDQDPTIGQIVFKAWNYDSNMVLVPLQLIEDSIIPLESVLNELLAERIAAITNVAYTTGAGSTTEPQGIVTGAAASGVTLPETTLGNPDPNEYGQSELIGNLIDLMHSVDSVYRSKNTCGFMMHDSTLAELKKTVDTTGRPLWLPNVALGQPDTILGKPVYVNNSMAEIGSGNKSCIFGDFSQFMIRDVNEMKVARFTERYAEYRQIGFLCWTRTDSKVLNSAAIKYAIHA